MAKMKAKDILSQKEVIECERTDTNKRLTPKERKRVVAKYLTCMSYKATAEQFGLTVMGVKHIVKNEPDFAKMYQEQREKEAKELFGVLSVKSKKFAKFCDIYFDCLADEKTIRELWKKDPEKVTRMFAINLDKFLLLDRARMSYSLDGEGDQNITINVVRKERLE